MPELSRKAAQFTESVIREMTRRFNVRAGKGLGGVNLAQGFPDFPCPPEMKTTAIAAINGDINQYAVTWGAPNLREAIAEKYRRFYDMPVYAAKHVTVCCGSTEAMMSALMAIINPGDEVVIFEPYYENYGPDVILNDCTPKYVRLRGAKFEIDEQELRAAFSAKTKAIIVNTPNNPTGKIFTREELELIASLCREHDAIAVTDEIYEHITYDGEKHIPIATLPDMADRTITISGASKTYSVTGWRVGWCIASERITAQLRKVHDFLTVGAPAPLQEAVAAACRFGDDFYANLQAGYAERRARIVPALNEIGFKCEIPRGAYYVMTDFTSLAKETDVVVAQRLIDEAGVATVPGSSFYKNPKHGAHQIRFCFPKKLPTLDEAVTRLREWAAKQK
jgi:aminotransferase